MAFFVHARQHETETVALTLESIKNVGRRYAAASAFSSTEPLRPGEVDVVVAARASHGGLVGVEHINFPQLIFDGDLRPLGNLEEAFARVDDCATTHWTEEKVLHQFRSSCKRDELIGVVEKRRPGHELRAVPGRGFDVGRKFAKAFHPAVWTHFLHKLVLGDLGNFRRLNVGGLPPHGNTALDSGQVDSAMWAGVKSMGFRMIGIVRPLGAASWMMPLLPAGLTAAFLAEASLVSLFTKPVAARGFGAVGAVGLKPGLELLDFLGELSVGVQGLLQHRFKLGDPSQGGAVVVHSAFHGQVK